MVSGTKEFYVEKAANALKNQFNYKNFHEIPKLEKIVLNIGLGKAKENKNLIQNGLKALTEITGQKAVVTKAKKSIAGFKLREGMDIGVKVTLRKDKMWDFLARLINIYIPRIRDFHGLNPKAFDGKGNYTLGVNDMRIFPEISIDLAISLSGMAITLISTTDSDEEAFSLLREVGLPMKKSK